MIKPSIEAAKPDKLFYFVANVALVNPANQTCLLLKRGADEKEANGLWGFPGGKAEHGQIGETGRSADFFAKVALRESKEEAGLTFRPDQSLVIANGVFIRQDGIPVIFVTLAAACLADKVRLEKGSFSDYGWFTKNTLPPENECAGNVHGEALAAINSILSMTAL